MEDALRDHLSGIDDQGAGAAYAMTFADLQVTAMTDGWSIKDRLDHVVDAVIDSGECGLEPTTVVDWSEGYPEVTRVGAGDPSPFE